MTNPKYKKGSRKEYAIINKLKAEGYEIAQRSAGSKSPVDIWAVKKETKTIKLIQSKPNNFSESETAKIMSENDWLNGNFEVEFVVE